MLVKVNEKGQGTLVKLIEVRCFESSEAYVASVFVVFRSKEISRKAILDVFAVRIPGLSARPSHRESFSSIFLFSENNYVTKLNAIIDNSHCRST